MLLARFALLQSAIHQLYWAEETLTETPTALLEPTDASRRLVAAIELIWIAIYCVKACYLSQFKLYKPPLCSVGFLFTIVQPIVLCATREQCRYIDGSNNRSWEVAITVVDIVTDVVVMSIPYCLFTWPTMFAPTLSRFRLQEPVNLQHRGSCNSPSAPLRLHRWPHPGRHPTATAAGGGGDEADNAEPSQPQDGSLSDLPLLSTA
ncbi:hypothetical protein PMIN01_00707 [Paraphaeosphaeria minitans]|uniref:Uncharacterized protein n=1 Tax=Paraphaeosphaeria minitans TaxID=565426 RepID=A0A9P6GTC8_9PLEO|nr:hypothetical protein PMIN01_00707 [Paraphaeosphaeria minitans]